MDCVADWAFFEKKAPLLSSELHTVDCGSCAADGARRPTPSCPPCANYPYASLLRPARWPKACANRPHDSAVGAVSSALPACRVRAQKSASDRKTPPDHQRADAQMAPTSRPRWRTPLPSPSRPTSRAFVGKELLKCSLSPSAARPWHAPPASLDATSSCTCLVRCLKGLLRCVAAIYIVCKYAGGLVKWESTSGDRCAARGAQKRYFFVRLPTIDTPRPS